MVVSSSSDRRRDSSSAAFAVRKRFWRSVLSNCRNKGAVLDWMSMLRASARRTASSHRFRISDTSCRKASSRTPASRSVVRSFCSKSLMRSLCSLRIEVFSCCASCAADLRVESTSCFNSLDSAINSLTRCCRDKIVLAFSSASERVAIKSVSSFPAMDSPCLADARYPFRLLTSLSSSATLSRACSFSCAWWSISSLSSRVSALAARTDFSIADCFIASACPSSINSSMICCFFFRSSESPADRARSRASAASHRSLAR
mmetsp:Transcript_17399/g.48014  ORF Transcript_17399/g.48014 Transcript_17399/m.48014 type:complete len:260 (-) Transcript_17399:832-1611(-)